MEYRYYTMEQRLKQIKNFALEGKTIKESMELTGLKYQTLKNYASQVGVKFKEEKQEKIDNYAPIIEAIKDGAIHNYEISFMTGIKLKTIKSRAQEARIKLPGNNLTLEEKADLIREALEGGANSMEELCYFSKSKPTGLRVICERYGIELPEEIIPLKFKPEIDNLIGKGWSLKWMGWSCDPVITEEGVRQYLLVSGQYKTWKKARETTPRYFYPKGV
jgi:hypothetical protein